MSADPATVATAHRCHRATERLHNMVYFAPEHEQRLTEVGLRPGRMCYFAGRAAPMGAVGPGVVAAVFYNFSPDLIARVLPLAWTLTTPERVVAARVHAAGEALRRLLGDEVAAGPEVVELAELTRAAAGGCTPEGRPLYAGHAEMDWPDDPVLQLWHAVTLLREHRGDGHIAALVQADLSGIEAIVTHTATGRGFVPEAAKKLRGWSGEQWAAAVTGLRERGVLDDAGELTPAGGQLRADVEEATGRSATAPWARLAPEQADRVVELGTALTRRIVAAGAYPDGVFMPGALKV